MDQTQSASNHGHIKEDSTEESLKRAIEHHKNQIEEIQKALEALEKLNFREGDVAFHKEFGNVLVVRFVPVKDLGSYFRNKTGYTEEELEKEHLLLEVIHGKNNSSIVKDSDLIPINEITVKIYGR